MKSKRKSIWYTVNCEGKDIVKKVRKPSLLRFVDKGQQVLQQLLDQTKGDRLSANRIGPARTITQALQQQKSLFNYPGAKINDHIVSLANPYVRPLKSEKKNKEVEFGLKVHMTHVGGINVTENASFNNLKECNILKINILNHRKQYDK